MVGHPVVRADTTGLHRLPHAERALSEAAAGIKHTTHNTTQHTTQHTTGRRRHQTHNTTQHTKYTTHRHTTGRRRHFKHTTGGGGGGTHHLYKRSDDGPVGIVIHHPLSRDNLPTTPTPSHCAIVCCHSSDGVGGAVCTATSSAYYFADH